MIEGIFSVNYNCYYERIKHLGKDSNHKAESATALAFRADINSFNETQN